MNMVFEEGALFILFSFVVITLVVLVLFWVGGRIGAKGRKTPDKLARYTGGEKLPTVKVQVNVERFFLYALFFMIFDAFAFLVALSFAQLGVYPILFTIITFLAIIMVWYNGSNVD
jgi:NADH:ubiquinone oxidoreductase subunit 3 (subunit A)